MYEELVKRLREHAEFLIVSGRMKAPPNVNVRNVFAEDYAQAADAIEELLKAAKSMHTWIFLNTGDEQAAYDECGLTDEMNAMLGYGGQFVAEQPKEET